MPMPYSVGRSTTNIVQAVHTLPIYGSRTDHAPTGRILCATVICWLYMGLKWRCNDEWGLELNWKFNRFLQQIRLETNHCSKIRTLQLLKS